MDLTKIEKTNELTKEKMKKKSFLTIPNNASERGLTPQVIKELSVAHLFDNENSMISEMDRIVEETNNVIKEVDENKQQQIDLNKQKSLENESRLNNNVASIEVLQEENVKNKQQIELNKLKSINNENEISLLKTANNEKTEQINSLIERDNGLELEITGAVDFIEQKVSLDYVDKVTYNTNKQEYDTFKEELLKRIRVLEQDYDLVALETVNDPSELMLDRMEAGSIFKVRDAFVTEDDFLEGPGIHYPALTRIAVVYDLTNKRNMFTALDSPINELQNKVEEVQSSLKNINKSIDEKLETDIPVKVEEAIQENSKETQTLEIGTEETVDVEKDNQIPTSKAVKKMISELAVTSKPSENKHTPVLVDGETLIDKVYFNTSLSVDEVKQQIEKLVFNGQSYVICSNSDLTNVVAVSKEYGAYMLVTGNYSTGNSSNLDVLFVAEDLGLGFVGWKPTFNGEYSCNYVSLTEFQPFGLNYIGEQNELITKLVSSTPTFVEEDLTNYVLTVTSNVVEGEIFDITEDMFKPIDILKMYHSGKPQMVVDCPKSIFGRVTVTLNQGIAFGVGLGVLGSKEILGATVIFDYSSINTEKQEVKYNRFTLAYAENKISLEKNSFTNNGTKALEDMLLTEV